MDTGWLLSNGAWYYLDVNGEMQTGWVKLDDDYYYFYGNGVEATNAWIGNYYLKADGTMAVSEWVDNDRYYVDENGVWVANKAK